jgi:uncharacterized protein
MITIKMIYAPAAPQAITYLECTVPEQTTVYAALQHAAFFSKHPELDLKEHLCVGIYGERVSLDTRLKDQDRIEIYRPLIMDPKTRRALRHSAKLREKQLG